MLWAESILTPLYGDQKYQEQEGAGLSKESSCFPFFLFSDKFGFTGEKSFRISYYTGPLLPGANLRFGQAVWAAL